MASRQREEKIRAIKARMQVPRAKSSFPLEFKPIYIDIAIAVINTRGANNWSNKVGFRADGGTIALARPAAHFTREARVGKVCHRLINMIKGRDKYLMPPLHLINRRLGLYQAVEVHVASLFDGVRVQTGSQLDSGLGRICKSSINAFDDCTFQRYTGTVGYPGISGFYF